MLDFNPGLPHTYCTPMLLTLVNTCNMISNNCTGACTISYIYWSTLWISTAVFRNQLSSSDGKSWACGYSTLFRLKNEEHNGLPCKQFVQKIHELRGTCTYIHRVHRITIGFSESECVWIETENKRQFKCPIQDVDFVTKNCSFRLLPKFITPIIYLFLVTITFNARSSFSCSSFICSCIHTINTESEHTL